MAAFDSAMGSIVKRNKLFPPIKHDRRIRVSSCGERIARLCTSTSVISQRFGFACCAAWYTRCWIVSKFLRDDVRLEHFQSRVADGQLLTTQHLYRTPHHRPSHNGVVRSQYPRLGWGMVDVPSCCCVPSQRPMPDASNQKYSKNRHSSVDLSVRRVYHRTIFELTAPQLTSKLYPVLQVKDDRHAGDPEAVLVSHLS